MIGDIPYDITASLRNSPGNVLSGEERGETAVFAGYITAFPHSLLCLYMMNQLHVMRFNARLRQKTLSLRRSQDIKDTPVWSFHFQDTFKIFCGLVVDTVVLRYSCNCWKGIFRYKRRPTGSSFLCCHKLAGDHTSSLDSKEKRQLWKWYPCRPNPRELAHSIPMWTWSFETKLSSLVNTVIFPQHSKYYLCSESIPGHKKHCCWPAKHPVSQVYPC